MDILYDLVTFGWLPNILVKKHQMNTFDPFYNEFN